MSQTVKAAFHALANQLKTITQANGYKTNAGENLRVSYMAWVLDQNPSPPFIVLQHGATNVTTTSGNAKAKLEYTPEILLATAATEAGIDELLDLEADLRKCLQAQNFKSALGGAASALEAPGSQPAILDDSSYALAVMPVTLTLIENYEA